MIVPNLYSFVQGQQAAQAFQRALLQADINNLRSQQFLRQNQAEADLVTSQAADLLQARNSYRNALSQGASPFQALGQLSNTAGFFAAPHVANTATGLSSSVGYNNAYAPLTGATNMFGASLNNSAQFGEMLPTPAAQSAAFSNRTNAINNMAAQAELINQQRAQSQAMQQLLQQQLHQAPAVKPVIPIAPQTPALPTVQPQQQPPTPIFQQQYNLNKLPKNLNVGPQQTSSLSSNPNFVASASMSRQQSVPSFNPSALVPAGNYTSNAYRGGQPAPSYFLAG
jgi:hypothetical protein